MRFTIILFLILWVGDGLIRNHPSGGSDAAAAAADPRFCMYAFALFLAALALLFGRVWAFTADRTRPAARAVSELAALSILLCATLINELLFPSSGPAEAMTAAVSTFDLAAYLLFVASFLLFMPPPMT